MPSGIAKTKLEFIGFAVLLGIVLIFNAAATALPVITSGDKSIQFTLWQRRQVSQGTTASISLQDLPNCGRTKEPLQAASVFAILAIFSNVVGIVLTVLEAIRKPVHKWATEMAGGFLLFCVTLVWILEVTVFKSKLCGNGIVPEQSGYTLGESVVLFIVVFVLLLCAVTFMVAMKAHIRPNIIEKEPPNPLDGMNALERRKSSRSFVPPAPPSSKKPSSSASAIYAS